MEADQLIRRIRQFNDFTSRETWNKIKGVRFLECNFVDVDIDCITATSWSGCEDLWSRAV